MRFNTYAKRVMAALLVVLLMGAPSLHGGEGLDGLTGDGALATMVRENDPRGGIWVRVGGGATARLELETARRLPVVLHHLEPDPSAVADLRTYYDAVDEGATVLVEHWTAAYLPHADNSVNVLIAPDLEQVPESEVLRVLAPGGTALVGIGNDARRIEKPWREQMGQWQQLASGRGQVFSGTDRLVGLPQGLQWVKGPLFAMAERKLSTPSAITEGGRIFIVTDNVLENLDGSRGKFLVARDAFNGMLLWSRPWDGQTLRLAATADRVYYGSSEGLVVVGAADGRTRQTIPMDAQPSQVILADPEGILVVETPAGVIAFDPANKTVLWEFKDETTNGTIVSNGRVFLLVSGRNTDGSFRHDLVCLELPTGNGLWRGDISSHIETRSGRIEFAAGGGVAVQGGRNVHMFSQDTGEHRWSRDADSAFYQHGLVWQGATRASGSMSWVGLDPDTGEQKRELSAQGRPPRSRAPTKAGCQPLIATDAGILVPRQGSFIDFETGERQGAKFVRGGCRIGVLPANGLIYSFPHACVCFSEAIRGLLAAHSDMPPEAGDDVQGRLYVGPAAGRQAATNSSPAASDWPMHRYGVERGAASPVKLDESLSMAWSVRVAPQRDSPAARDWKLRVGEPVTAATVVGDRVFAADVNHGRVVCLDRQTGGQRWSFTANGRIDTPPTLAGGLCLFGARDGYVYALDAEDGQLVWRFRAAPLDRRIGAFGSLESRWPVAGTVLVQNGTLYAAAGRSPDADGGIHVHALEPLSGEPRWSVKMDDEDFVGVSDYLVGDGENIFLCEWRFQTDGTHGPAEDSNHLREDNVGLLESSWTKIGLGIRIRSGRTMQFWRARGQRGQLLAFDDEDIAVYDHFESTSVTFNGSSEWSYEIESPVQVTALAMTADHVLVAGGKDRNDDSAGGAVWLLDRDSGKVQSELSLPSAVTFDGLAVAHGKVFVSTRDGRLTAFGP